MEVASTAAAAVAGVATISAVVCSLSVCRDQSRDPHRLLLARPDCDPPFVLYLSCLPPDGGDRPAGGDTDSIGNRPQAHPRRALTRAETSTSADARSHHLVCVMHDGDGCEAETSTDCTVSLLRGADHPLLNIGGTKTRKAGCGGRGAGLERLLMTSLWIRQLLETLMTLAWEIVLVEGKQ